MAGISYFRFIFGGMDPPTSFLKCRACAVELNSLESSVFGLSNKNKARKNEKR
jgi:hypothetical protein